MSEATGMIALQLESADTLSVKINAITFGLIAKLLLSKNVVEIISGILENLLIGLIQPDEAIKSIGEILKNYHAVNQIWRALTDRKSIRMSRLYNDLEQIIRRLLENGVPEYYIISFLSTIINATQHNVRRVDLISLILSYKFLRKYQNISITYLLVNGLRIASRIHPNPMFDKVHPVFNVRNLIVDPEVTPLPPPSIRYRPKEKTDLSTSQNDSEEEEEEIIGHSYVPTEFFISPLPSTFILNTYAKSTRVGSEGGDTGKMSEFERFYSYIKCYASSMFELFVTADISYYANSHIKTNSRILQYNAINDLYAIEAPSILKYVRQSGDSKFVKIRCAENILRYAIYRYRVQEKVKAFSDVYPVLDELPSINFSQKSEPTIIDFNISRSNICFLLGEISVSHLRVLNKFINTVLPIFTLSKSEIGTFIVNEYLANALYYFARSSDELDELLATPKGVEPSLQAIVDAAVFEVESKCSNVVKSEVATFLDSFFGKFIRNGDDFYTMVDEAIAKFGSKTDNFFRLVCDIEKLTAIVEKFFNDKNSQTFIKVAKMYSKASGINAREMVNSRIPLMTKYLTRASIINRLLRIDINGSENKAKIFFA
ncbi:hypothetical protein TVAG_174120 [Trichomonas vaginalis G3]|uniref:Uncharacterized protein n=1 Tax=Trichomonas vaginalis (strain ATCC PRA-98 / G3) TaxID=412133 RepID=A2EWV5_TRIV3|nr:hypothetical protein TVAGG3_0813570 [Trichomonas vaginalis G3]EAY02870.1 hypothetical protein TVAG_174120 [Trichomonas vaginalis G3]KAI5497384.1 hypothetical protein TVAGG3_0813570 [Trichomonas vaginalis G3]|eukprot:XP_001315093.1 hypothetical protein [Trichomonas vaginalis G3]